MKLRCNFKFDHYIREIMLDESSSVGSPPMVFSSFSVYLYIFNFLLHILTNNFCRTQVLLRAYIYSHISNLYAYYLSYNCLRNMILNRFQVMLEKSSLHKRICEIFVYAQNAQPLTGHEDRMQNISMLGNMIFVHILIMFCIYFSTLATSYN